MDIGRELDDRFAVNISKQIVVLPHFVQAEIKKLAEPARKESRRKYRKDETSRRPVDGVPVGAPGRVADGRAPGVGAKPSTGPATGSSAQPDGDRGAGPKIPVRTVKSSAFAWKIGKSMSGGRDVQVSDQELALVAHLESVRSNPLALASLVDFLERLDQGDAQKALLSARH